MRIVDADALKHEFERITYTRYTADMGQGGFEMFSEKEIENIIDKAPTVADDMAGAYNEGYMCGSRENKRPKGEWIIESEPDENDNIQTLCPFCRHSDTHSKSVIVSYCWNCGADLRGGTE